MKPFSFANIRIPLGSVHAQTDHSNKIITGFHTQKYTEDSNKQKNTNKPMYRTPIIMCSMKFIYAWSGEA